MSRWLKSVVCGEVLMCLGVRGLSVVVLMMGVWLSVRGVVLLMGGDDD